MNNEIACVHFDRCSGCTINSCKNPPPIFEHASHYFSAHWQVNLQFKQRDIRAWRTRAKLASRPPGIFGLFEKGTHSVVSIPHCQVHHPKINEAIGRLENAVKDSCLSAYDEKSHKGDLRYVQCVVERQTGKVQLSLVLNMPQANDRWLCLAERLYDPVFWNAIWFNYNDKPLNTIFGKSWEKIKGQDVIWEHIAGLEVAFGPSHFGQANLQMYEELIFDIKSRIIQDATVCELYSGIGVIGLAVVEKSKEVRLCELEASAQYYYNLAKLRLAAPLQNKLSYLVGKAQECLELVDGAEVCIVDPPRKGLGHELVHKILSTPGLKQVIYISCEWKSLERDLDFIKLHHKEWGVSWASSYLFFPGTNQIETLLFLQRHH